MGSVRVADVLRGEIPVGSTVTVEGWVRTRRDTKAGMSFVAVHDGSGFNPLQVIAPQELPNYESEIKRVSAGCSVRAIGELLPSPAAGQAVELRATSIEVVG